MTVAHGFGSPIHPALGGQQFSRMNEFVLVLVLVLHGIWQHKLASTLSVQGGLWPAPGFLAAQLAALGFWSNTPTSKTPSSSTAAWRQHSLCALPAHVGLQSGYLDDNENHVSVMSSAVQLSDGCNSTIAGTPL